MTKRLFMKLASLFLGQRFVSSAVRSGEQRQAHGAEAPGTAPLLNWAGNYRYGTDTVSQAGSTPQAQALVKQHPRLKVLGTRHCFNGIADSTEHLISLQTMDQVVALDPTARTVTVEAGVRYGQLGPYLHERGFALHNLASLPHISVAGACATATHGSGVKNGNLATAVSGMELITAGGEARTVSRDRDGRAFPGAVVHLGALGVVTRVTLDIQPTFLMRQEVYENLPMAQLKDHFDTIMSSGYSVSLFTDWQRGRVNEVWVKSLIREGAAADPPREFYGATRATKDLHPIAELPAENCTEQRGVPGPWYERLPHFRMGFTPSSGKELQAEYFVPLHNGVEAILAIERLRDRVAPHLQISELRTVAADDLWMSPCYRQSSLAIHFTLKPDWDSVRKLLPVIETELAPFRPRPHWGKLFTLAPAVLQSRYEKLPEFKALVQEHDPRGQFRNEFLATNLELYSPAR
jgi:xylitol oxidase